MSDQTRELADSAADAISELSRLTASGHDDLRLPIDVYEIVVGLCTMTGRLPQLFAQLASWLLAEGRVAHDGGDEARQQIGQVIASLSDATAAVREVAAGLAEAANSAVGLTAVPNA